MIRVGRVWLEARIDQTPPTRDLAIATRDLALALVSQAMRALGDDAITKVRVVEGSDTGAMLALEDEGRAYVVGRDERCDMPLADADASREHAQIARRGGTVLVRDMGSKNGVILGASRIPADRDVVWKSGTLVRIGKTALTLDEPAASALAELEEADDEPMKSEDVPPMPAPSSTKVPAAAPNTTGSAPIADLANASKSGLPVIARAPKHRWSATDLAVVAAALAVMGLSIAGLVWLLRG
jgi:pSer/pThr/pTyr-binding forkhead associated (FHA) protein